ncbi:MAG: PqqD family protein [Endomicrobiales bacterium]|nr:PqqD family protein [Endomicrobiales bacterium]
MKIRRTPHVAYRIISGQAFVVNTKNSTLHELDEVGTFIWKLIKGTGESSKIVNKVYKNYEVDRKKAQDDVMEFLSQLKEKGLIDICKTRK